MTPDTVQVVIYDAPAAQASEVAPAVAAAMAMTTTAPATTPWPGSAWRCRRKALALTLNHAFPGRVEVSYINVLTDPRGPSLPQTALLKSQTFPAPLVYINGEGRFAGALIPERIRDEVAKILEAH